MSGEQFGICGELHPKDHTGYMGAAIPEIGLFTQAKNEKALARAVEEAFFDLFGVRLALEFTKISDEQFVLSSPQIMEFYGLVLKGARGERSFRSAMRLLNDKSTAALQRYEKGETAPSLPKAIEMLGALGDGESKNQMLVWMPRKALRKAN